MAESREIKPRRHVFFASMILSAALLTLTRLLTDFGGSTVNIPTNVGSIDKIIYGHSQKPTISDRLFSDPSSFSDLTSNSKECDASQQKSWEARASSGYEGELKDSCIIPKEGLDNYYGPSGPGSSLAATQELRKMLPSVFQELNIKTFMDAACGDWLWMQTVNLTGVQYFGGDISNITVQKNRDCFGAENIHFDWFDITCMIPPPVDLILVRDILFHLPHHLILEVFANINSSGARYFATTSFSEGENELRSRAIGFHQLNLYASPFNFPLPLHKANDNVPGRHVGIWKLPLQFNIDNSNSSKDSAMTSKNNSNWQHLDITDEPPIHILHVIWGRPLPTDGGYAGKERILDNETFTGCCDSLIELALRSYISILPEDFKILFWNMGGWNTEKYLTHIGLADKNILPMNFDPTKELAGDQNLIEVYEKLSSVVPRSDFVRYAVMRNYGGSYVDIDGIMVRPLPLDGVPRVNLSPTKATGGHITCSGKGYVMQPGSCILSNGFFVGFPRNHAVFTAILGTIRTEKRSCGGHVFFCYGPQWMTKTLMKTTGITDIAEIGVRVEPLLRNGGSYKIERNVVIAHFDLDAGDMKCDLNEVLSELCKKFHMSINSEHTKQEYRPEDHSSVFSAISNDI